MTVYSLDDWPIVDEAPYSAKLRASIQAQFDAVAATIDTLPGLTDQVALIANNLGEPGWVYEDLRTNIGVYSKAETATQIASTMGLDDAGDLTLQTGAWSIDGSGFGQVHGGVIQNATSLQMTQTNFQSARINDPAVGSAVRFTYNVIATDNLSGLGSNVGPLGQGSPGGVFQLQGHIYVGVDQTRLTWSPIGWQSQYVYGNLPSAGDIILAQGWDFLSARTFLTDGVTVSWMGPDSAFGGASFIDNQLHITQNDGIAAVNTDVSGTHAEVISFMSLPFLLGNTTKTVRAAFDVFDINSSEDSIYHLPDVDATTLIRGVPGNPGLYPGIDDPNLFLPENIGLRIHRMLHGDARLGIKNSSGIATPPLAVTLRPPVTGVTTTKATHTFNRATHGYANGTAVVPGGFTNVSGFTAGRVYYIVNAQSGTFQLSKWPNAKGNPVQMSGSTDDAGITISQAIPRGASLVDITSSTANPTLAVPAIEDGIDGETVVVRNVGTNPFAVSDNAVIAGSNVLFGGPRVRSLATNQEMRLTFSAVKGGWTVSSSIPSLFQVADGTDADGLVQLSVANLFGSPLAGVAVLANAGDTKPAAAMYVSQTGSVITPSWQLGGGGSTPPDITVSRVAAGQAEVAGSFLWDDPAAAANGGVKISVGALGPLAGLAVLKRSSDQYPVAALYSLVNQGGFYLGAGGINQPDFSIVYGGAATAIVTGQLQMASPAFINGFTMVDSSSADGKLVATVSNLGQAFSVFRNSGDPKAAMIVGNVLTHPAIRMGVGGTTDPDWSMIYDNAGGVVFTGKVGWFGHAAAAQPTGTPAAATDVGTTQTLVNSLRSALLALGIVA